MKKNSFIYLIAVFFTLFTGLTVSSCKDDMKDEMSAGLSIKVFSPTKVIEGQEVMITGTGLTEVTSVVFPGEKNVTDIKVINSGLISVITPAGIPADGGELTVQAGDQSVTARIPLTIGKPQIATLSPNKEAGTGQALTITGTDMEFYEKAIFPGEDGNDIVINAIDFERKSTSLLRVKVPFGIQEGPAQIKLVTVANKEELLPEIALEVIEVQTPTPFTGTWVWADGDEVYASGGYGNSTGPGWSFLSKADMLSSKGESPDNEMVFGFEEKPSFIKQTADGTILGQAKYKFNMSKQKGTWSIGELEIVVEEGETATSVLCGTPRWGGDPILVFDILALDEDKMILAWAADGTAFGTWQDATFWSFKRKNTRIPEFPANLNLTQGGELKFEDKEIKDMADWWIDPDFFTRVQGTDNRFTFKAIEGNYRINADKALKYFTAEVLSDGNPATLKDDGTGAIWVIGDGGIGKPSKANGINWTPDKALCMAPIGDKKYRITLVAGEQIGIDAINFKFFHQKNWGGEFTHDKISTTSDLILIGDGNNGADSGNLILKPGVMLESGAAYEFVVDLSGGNDNAVLTVTKR